MSNVIYHSIYNGTSILCVSLDRKKTSHYLNVYLNNFFMTTISMTEPFKRSVKNKVISKPTSFTQATQNQDHSTY